MLKDMLPRYKTSENNTQEFNISTKLPTLEEIEAMLSEMAKQNLEDSKKFASSQGHVDEINRKIKGKIQIIKPVQKRIKKGTQKGK